MRVTSVNLSNDTNDYRQNNLAVELHILCLNLSAPNEKFYKIFDQLKFSGITKNPQEKINLEPGGVVGDRHYMPNVIIKEHDAFYKLSPYKQVSLMSKERYTELNQLYNKNIQAGQFGENIQIEDFASIEKVSQGTVLQLGETAQVRVMHLRTFCYKFSTVLFPTADMYFAWIKSKKDQIIRRIGVTGQVIKSGTVGPNDTISVVYTPPEHVDLRYFDPLVDGVASRIQCGPPTNA